MGNRLLFTILFIFSFYVAKTQIHFDDRGWMEILADAKESEKLVFVYLYADWAGPCKWMKKNVFRKQDVSSFYNLNFINVKVHIESDLGIEMKRIHKVKKIPTYLFLSFEEKEVYMNSGKIKSDKFLELGKGIRRNF